MFIYSPFVPLPALGRLNGVLRRSGSEEILQGSKNGCVLIRKKVYGVGARRDGWSRPLPLGAPRPMIF